MYFCLDKLWITTSASRPQLWNNNLTWWFFSSSTQIDWDAKYQGFLPPGAILEIVCVFAISLKLTTRTWKWIVGRLISCWETLFSGAVWNFRGVTQSNQKKRSGLARFGPKKLRCCLGKEEAGHFTYDQCAPKAQCFQREMDTNAIEIVHIMPLHEWFDPF